MLKVLELSTIEDIFKGKQREFRVMSFWSVTRLVFSDMMIKFIIIKVTNKSLGASLLSFDITLTFVKACKVQIYSILNSFLLRVVFPGLYLGLC